jgi:hypothetical protein
MLASPITNSATTHSTAPANSTTTPANSRTSPTTETPYSNSTPPITIPAHSGYYRINWLCLGSDWAFAVGRIGEVVVGWGFGGLRTGWLKRVG